MAATTAPKQCAYPGCDQPTAAPGSDRGAKPKYCDDPDHNPLAAHRERRRRQAEDSGQRAEESGGQPVTFGITRAAELVGALEKLTAQHADTLTRAITELRAVGDIESAEAEVYAARTSADQRVATAEARLAEEIQRRRDAESERDAARADREQADDATAQAVSRMDDLRARTCRTTRLHRSRGTPYPRQRSRGNPAGPRRGGPRHQRRPRRRRPPGRRRRRRAPSKPSRSQPVPARPRPPPSSAPSTPRPPQPTRPPASAPTTSTHWTSSPPPPTPASPPWKKPATHCASAPSEQKATLTPPAPKTSALPNNSPKRPTPRPTRNRPTHRHHAPGRRAAPRRHQPRRHPVPRVDQKPDGWQPGACHTRAKHARPGQAGH